MRTGIIDLMPTFASAGSALFFASVCDTRVARSYICHDHGTCNATPALAQPRVTEFQLSPFVAVLLQGERLVEHEAAGARTAAHAPLLLAVRQDFVLVGLMPLHATLYFRVCATTTKIFGDLRNIFISVCAA